MASIHLAVCEIHRSEGRDVFTLSLFSFLDNGRTVRLYLPDGPRRVFLFLGKGRTVRLYLPDSPPLASSSGVHPVRPHFITFDPCGFWLTVGRGSERSAQGSRTVRGLVGRSAQKVGQSTTRTVRGFTSYSPPIPGGQSARLWQTVRACLTVLVWIFPALILASVACS